MYDLEKKKEIIKKWINSLSGFQGGNPNANLWVCGLEYQAFDVSDWESTSTPITKPPYLDLSLHEEHFNGTSFNDKILQFAEIYYGEKIDKKDLFYQNGKVFKLNLFPLPKPVSEQEMYNKEVFEKTGIMTKSELVAICLEKNGRWSKFKSLINAYNNKNKVIICFGIKSLDHFLLAFEETDEFYKKKEELEKSKIEIINHDNNKKESFFYCKLSSGDILVVVRFPRYSFSKKYIKKICKEISKLKNN